MITLKTLSAIFAIALLAAACGQQDRSTGAVKPATSVDSEITATEQISGIVTYRERMALTPTAELNVQLQDVSLADVAAKVIAERNIVNPGQVPISFQLDYDPALIVDRNTYAVRATIYDDKNMLFTTDTHYPVITRGNGNSVEMVLVRTGMTAASSPTELLNTYWQLTTISGQPIPITDNQRAPFLRLTEEGSIAQGFSGCNQFSGSWNITNDQIELGPMAMTMMACPGIDDLEQNFMAALEAMDRHEIVNTELAIYQGDRELLRFRVSDTPL